MIQATLDMRTRSLRESESLLRAVTPDSLGMRGLRFGGKARSDGFEIVLSCDGRIETFISSLDDLLACLQAATAALKKMTGRKLD